MAGIDIRPIKQNLRAKYKAIRRSFSPSEKAQKDDGIFRRVVALQAYKDAELFLTFVSTEIEVDTKRLITQALADGKRVAVPKCVDHTIAMDFYLIHSLEDLYPQTFSVLEPDVTKCEKLTAFDKSVCIVPGLAFDPQGYRLGYGKGYYDRFLDKYSEITIGVCYNACINQQLPHGRYDKAVNLIVTEKYTKKIG